MQTTEVLDGPSATNTELCDVIRDMRGAENYGVGNDELLWAFVR